jgi:hypothetical protein
MKNEPPRMISAKTTMRNRIMRIPTVDGSILASLPAAMAGGAICR